MWWIIPIIVLAILIPYFITCHIAFNKIFKRGKEIPLISLDLSKTQYKDYEIELREYTSFFDDIKPEIVSIKSNDGLTLKGYYYKNKLDKLIICFHGYRAIPLNNFPVKSKCFAEVKIGINSFFTIVYTLFNLLSPSIGFHKSE